MHKLMMTSALAAALAVPALAQTTDPTAPAPAQAPAAGAAAHVPAFRASTFTGMRLYAFDTDLSGTSTGADARWTSGAAFEAERDRWENIGSINDIVMTQDGEIRGVLVDIGGFLGFGAHTVMVSMDELFFVPDETTPENLNDFNVVAAVSRAELEALPAWSDDALLTGFAARDPGSVRVTDPAAGTATDPMTGTTTGPVTGMDTTTTAPPADAMDDTMAGRPTADELLGATVYEPGGEAIGSVSDLVLNSASEVDAVLIDVGGFLGMGAHTVALPVDRLDVVRETDGSGTLRVQVQMTREQLEALPEHQG